MVGGELNDWLFVRKWIVLFGDDFIRNVVICGVGMKF